MFRVTKTLIVDNEPVRVGYNEFGNLMIESIEFTPHQADELVNAIGEAMSEAYAHDIRHITDKPPVEKDDPILAEGSAEMNAPWLE